MSVQGFIRWPLHRRLARYRRKGLGVLKLRSLPACRPTCVQQTIWRNDETDSISEFDANHCCHDNSDRENGEGKGTI